VAQPDRVMIFDTTLRDGEQSPGCSMTRPEKLRVARALADLGVDVIEAGFPAASKDDFDSVSAVAREVHGPIICGLARCNAANIPDTVGYTVPDEFAELFRYLRKNVRGIEQVRLSVHCHDDLGMAVANSLTAVVAGARQIECTINGIGERAGNCSLEEVVMALRVRRDILPFETGIETPQLYPASQLLTEIIGIGPQPNKAIVGQNAFAHEAGIHQDGFLK